jgi:hypothetical protein
MATVHRASSTIPELSTTQPSENNNPCLSRTTKIALAIFASLAGFVFLPFGMAIVLTAVVTLGAIVCCPGDDMPPSPSSSASPSVAPIEPTEALLPYSALKPTEIRILDTNAIAVPDSVMVSFQTLEAKRQFYATYRANFKLDANFYPDRNNPLRMVIQLQKDAVNEGKTVKCIIDELKNIFGHNKVAEVSVIEVD